LRREPAAFGYPQSRWTLNRLLTSCGWLRLESLGGLSRLLKRIGIRFKRARDYLHSPDPDYQAKLDVIALARLRAYYDPARYVLLSLDEVSYYRQPTLAHAYAACGHDQALAYRSYQSNTSQRVLATLDCLSGQVLYQQTSRTTVASIVRFWYQVAAAYREAERLYIVLDNWPVHFHPDGLAPLMAQQWHWPIKSPPNWPSEPSAKAKHDQLPIQLLCLPSYAAWLNPIEKLWRWLKQEVLHLHRQRDDWHALKGRVAGFLDGFANGSPKLLRYVGLLP
jgi:hypothetical protein